MALQLLTSRPFVVVRVWPLAVHPYFAAVVVQAPCLIQWALSYGSHYREAGHSRCPGEEIDSAQKTAAGAMVAAAVAGDVHKGRETARDVSAED